ncbi:hypothetical protein [Thalassospira sp.]|uniref:hypothetical protein n=1 Tax=Thalassospira sp. TaxID=1912094 RepID=UPI000C46F287|nr:hypothetical protein [Thalassospira sp.]MAL40641.1 hypothetical protein [Thalassospira sp.]HAY48757.1 hypothetical protein [Thalassospira sp.]|tara:strand:+ start:175 stop:1170 length:996 start_codon:yes stop_codon:yes gene_type:complete
MDYLGTFSGIIGVFLTIIFFAVGYRQTIGAKKERTSAANKELSEVLLRRFTVEDNFKINHEGVEKLLTGKSIEHKIDKGSLYSPQEFEAVLYTKVIEGDYISDDKRTLICSNIEKSFNKSEENFLTSRSKYNTKNKNETPLILLTVSSAFIGFVSTFLFYKYNTNSIDNIFPNSHENSLSIFSYQAPILTAAFITITALMLFTFTKYKEQTSTKNNLNTNDFFEFKNGILKTIKAKKKKFILKKGFDFVIDDKSSLIGVKLYLSIKKPYKKNVNEIVEYIEIHRNKANCSEALIVFNQNISQEIKNLSTDKITILSGEEFISQLETPEIIE